MKAISPSAPAPSATAPLRSDRGGEASAADEAFGALIAAALGAAPRPVVSHEAPPKQAASSVSNVNPSSSTKPSSSSDSTNSKADGDQPAVSGADQTDTTASAAKKADSSAAPPTVDASKPAAEPVVAAGTPVHAPVVPGMAPVVKAADGAATKTPHAVPAGLETATAALAQALTADAPATPVSPNPVLDGSATGPTPSALAQGQLPAQLVKLPTVPASSGESPTTPAHASPSPAAQATPVGTPVVATGPEVVKPQVAVVPQVPADVAVVPAAPNATTVSLSGQHDAQQGKGDERHSSSAATATAPAASDSKATPAPFDQALQAPGPVANVVVPAPVQQPVATAVSQAVVAPPAEQIVQVVAPLRTAKDGDYTLSLQLHPADLGPVTVRVDVHQGVLSVHMVADNAQGHDALNQSLNDLRSQLEAGGVRTGDIGLGSRASGQQLSQQQGQQQSNYHQAADTPAGRDGSTDRRPATSHRETVMASGDTALDVRI